jgi:hypothetical protein
MDKKLLKPIIITALITAVVAGAIAFDAGMRVGWEQAGLKPIFGNATGAAGAQRQAGAAGAARRINGASTVGEILSVDDMGITVKLAAGGSRRILLPPKVTVSSCAEGDKTAVAVGKFVIVSGDVNTDNSVTARNIQIMPTMPTTMPLGGRQGNTGATLPPARE